MTIQEIQNELEDAIFNRQLARNKFRCLCNSKMSIPDSIVEKSEIELNEANQTVKQWRFNLKQKLKE